MKKYIHTTCLMTVLCLLCGGCSEEVFMPSPQEGEAVTLSLSYSDVSPKEITVTRATEAEERHLDNLYIYIFDGNGNLKGFKATESGLDQDTNNSHQARISGIKTKVGEAYIYAVANVRTGLYPISTSSDIVEEGKLPIALDEDRAATGEYPFTKTMLMSLPFVRNNPNTIQISSAFLMSGAVSNGNPVYITSNGTLRDGDQTIKLRRIVSKVKLYIKAAAGNDRKFKLSSYDIMQIGMNGALIGYKDGNTQPQHSSTFSHITGNTCGVNDVDAQGRQFFECYLPENLQSAKNTVSTWDAREDDNQSEPKVFTNAPDAGTYLVLKGKYEETKEGITQSADVTYYIHLGDCSTDVNDYNVERNCKYTYNVTVNGVDNIMVEARKEGNEQPSAEGVVLEYGSAGKNLMLDSHYEYMVMRFYQNEIKTLKDNGHGYYFQVQDIHGKSDPMDVREEVIGNLNGASTDWVEFAIGGTYGTENNGRGKPCDYPGKNGSTKNAGLYAVEDFLKLLYLHAEDTDNTFWNKGTSGNRYIDATCFVDENYYADKTWDQYVNNATRRSFYVANEVEVSRDRRSIYAKAAYGLQQYNIQTFYNRQQAGHVIAYGCETLNDEEGKTGYSIKGKGSRYFTQGTDTWNGRANMVADIQKNSSTRYTWNELEGETSLIRTCMSRNRDLNGDGKISDDEVRWYAPTIQQYAGLWIGEEVVSTESKLFNKSTSTLSKAKDPECRMLYYAASPDLNTFFAEEGMATGAYTDSYPAKYVRCIRNLKSNAPGYASSPDKYYTYDAITRKVNLDRVDANALNISGEQGELTSHTERSDGNKPAQAFYIAKKKSTATTQKAVVEGNFKCSDKYTQDGKKWRVPNQREFCMMTLVLSNMDEIRGTFCRTKFSNTNFRYSWTYSSVFTMKEDVSDGYVRCISVDK